MVHVVMMIVVVLLLPSVARFVANVNEPNVVRLVDDVMVMILMDDVMT